MRIWTSAPFATQPSCSLWRGTMRGAERVRTQRIAAHLVVAAAYLAAVLVDWALTSPGYPVAAVYGVSLVLAAVLLEWQAVAVLSIAAVATSAFSNVAQRAPFDVVVFATLSLATIGALAAAVSRQRAAALAHERFIVETEARHRRAQNEFIALVTHELATPLTSIKGYAQLLERRNGANDGALATILREVSHMVRLVSDLQTASQTDAARLELRPDINDLLTIARRSIDRAHSAHPSLAAELVAPETPVEGRWDDERLEQVLVNLLANATKYAPGAPVVVRIGRAADQATIEVADGGPGIAPDALPHVFDRFYRADKRVATGLGLGLHVARVLVEAHGGTITVRSEVGVGTTFAIVLPLTPAIAGSRSAASRPA